MTLKLKLPPLPLLRASCRGRGYRGHGCGGGEGGGMTEPSLDCQEEGPLLGGGSWGEREGGGGGGEGGW